MKQNTTKKKRYGKTSMSEQQVLTRKIIKDIIEHSMKIADFNFSHKKYQKIFENRLIKKEENFITQDSNFGGKIFPSNDISHKWTFISKAIGKLITIEDNGEIKLYEFNTQNHKIYNILNDDNKIIIWAELYEYEQKADTRLLLLFQDFTFYTINLFILNSEKNEENNMKLLIDLASTQPFNFKPYLNIPDCNSYLPNYDYIKKIIIFPKNVNDNCNNIILNFSQIAGKFLVFNFISNSIIGNYLINHYDYEEPDDNNNLQNIYNFINIFVNKTWTLKQYEFASFIINSICSSQNEKDFTKLAKVLSLNENSFEDENSLEQIKEGEYSINDQETQNIYDSNIAPVIPFNLGNITIYSILDRLKTFFDKVYECFIAYINKDYSLIKGKFGIYLTLFMKCFSRNIKLKELFQIHDKEQKGYVDEQIAHELFNNLTIGFNKSELNEIFSKFNIIDENQKYMYNYLFESDEYLIAKIISFLPLNKSGKNIFSTKCENFDDSNQEPIYQNEVSQYIINSIFNKRDLTQIIFLDSSNLIFTITPYNKKIYIFQRNTKLTNTPEIAAKIGTINLNSFYNHPPNFLEYIPERNLLIAQRTTKYTTELVLIKVCFASSL